MVTDYTYTSCWVDSDSFISSANFLNKKYDMNIAPNFKSECFQPLVYVKSDNPNIFDAYELPDDCLKDHSAVGYEKEKLIDLYPVGHARPEFGKNELIDWSFEPDTGMLRRRKFVDHDTIGDLRVTFYVPK